MNFQRRIYGSALTASRLCSQPALRAIFAFCAFLAIDSGTISVHLVCVAGTGMPAALRHALNGPHRRHQWHVQRMPEGNECTAESAYPSTDRDESRLLPTLCRRLHYPLRSSVVDP